MTEPVRDAPTGFTPNEGPQTWFLQSPAYEVLYGGLPGGGKALSVHTLIATPKGWTTMGELSVGDQVFDDYGHPCSVTDVSPIYTDHKCYELTFSDGSSMIADAGHRWATLTKKERRQRITLTDRDWETHL